MRLPRLASQATDILRWMWDGYGLFIIPNVNCIIIALIDSVSGPLSVALNLALVLVTAARSGNTGSALILNYQLQFKEADLI